jgi:beta-galactosidase GanA
MHRSAHAAGHFFVTETRVGVAGDVVMWDPFPMRDQFRMWMLQPAAYGASGLMYWSGNRWHGGHWPHWGGVLDWTGQPEPDFGWLVEVGRFFDKEGPRLLRNPVDARAAVITDFDQRAALSVYKHVPASNQVLPETFDALHRLGIGTDSISVADAARAGRLSKYSLVVVPGATALDDPEIAGSLRKYVSEGGNVVLTPFTAYQSWDGVFRRDGFGGNLAELSGVVVRTARRMGTASDKGRKDQRVSWLGGVSPAGIDGYCEYMETRPGTEVIGRFESDEEILNGRAAATRRRLGKGAVIKLGFWPADDSLLALVRQLVPAERSVLAAAAPKGLQAVPRSDGSLFLINTTAETATVRFTRAVTDRISGGQPGSVYDVKPFEVLWLE